MTTRKAWWLYTILRLGLFIAAFGAVWLLGARGWLAAVLAAIISFAVSLLGLDPLRKRAAEGLHEWRTRDRTEDDIVEDDFVDAGGHFGADSSSPASEASASEAPTAASRASESPDSETPAS